MRFLQQDIRRRSGCQVLASSASGDQTDGIDAAGLRVAKEIQAACDALGDRGELSIVAHSNGGLVSRFALGDLESRGLLERWQPRTFLTLASPHLGVFAFGRWPPSLVQPIARLKYFGQAGRQLALLDAPPTPNNKEEPLLVTMADRASPYIQALRRFERRVTVSNVTNEVLVPYESAALVCSDELSAKAPTPLFHTVAARLPPHACHAVPERAARLPDGNVLALTTLPAMPQAPAHASTPTEEEAASGVDAHARARRDRMVYGLRSCGDWTRVDVDFGRGRVGWAHWLVAGHSLPLQPTVDGEGMDDDDDKASSCQAPDDSTNLVEGRGRRLQARAAVASGLRWLVRKLGHAEVLADVARYATAQVLAPQNYVVHGLSRGRQSARVWAYTAERDAERRP